MSEETTADRISWPDNKRFAFTVFDDTDFATLDNIREVYAFLIGEGFLTTKSVWPLDGPASSSWWGVSCEDRAYRDWVLDIRSKGVEIAFHNAAWESSERERTIEGLERFTDLFGSKPNAYACHAQCRENLYWGRERLSAAPNRLVYDATRLFRNRSYYQGHVEGSPWFWGDVCKNSIKYVRNFVFQQINTLAACPMMPYHDPARPYVNHWFASSEGKNCDAFVRCLSEPNQDALEEQGGACIMYTHFGWGFQQDGVPNAQFRGLMKRLASKNGWFVTVSTLLDYLLEAKKPHTITAAKRKHLERRWLIDRMRLRR